MYCSHPARFGRTTAQNTRPRMPRTRTFFQFRNRAEKNVSIDRSISSTWGPGRPVTVAIGSPSYCRLLRPTAGQLLNPGDLAVVTDGEHEVHLVGRVRPGEPA